MKLVILNKFKNYMYIKKIKRNKCSIASNVDIVNSSFGKYCNLAHSASVINCEIGKRTSIGRYSKLRDCKIGKYCSISWDVTIGAVSHPMDTISSHAFTYRKSFGIVDYDANRTVDKTIIGNDVWIGCGAIILSGVKIGNGSIIGAGAVVTKDVEPYSIVVGVPAKKIKERFPQNISKKIEQLKWWDLDDETIKNNQELFKVTVDESVLKKLEGEIK